MAKHSEISIEDIEQQEADSRAFERWYEEQEEYQNREDMKNETWNHEDYVDEIPGAQSALDLFEKGLTKSDIKAMAAAAVESVLNKGNVLQVAEALAAMQNFIKTVEDDKRFYDYVREEAAKTPKGFISKSGAKIELCESGTSYDFSKCGDPQLVNLERVAKEATDLIKVRKDFLKTIPAGGIDIRIEDELVTIYPPTKTSTSSYKITLAK